MYEKGSGILDLVTLGRTGITVNKNGFGCLPIQRIPKSEAVYLLQKAFYNGMNFFDTARMYTDSEEKMGEAFQHIRHRLFLASKSRAANGVELMKELDTTLKLLKTDYLDIYQFHNHAHFVCPDDGTGIYEAALEAKRQGKIRFIGMSSHKNQMLQQAIDSDLYDTVQFPFNYLSTEIEHSFVKQCAEKNIGYIAMKGMSGGLITSGRAAYSFMMRHENVLPIWGIQKEAELDEFLSCDSSNLMPDEELEALIKKDREELKGEFCRSCGYCLPCPSNIEIPKCARMTLLLGRSVIHEQTTPQVQANMENIVNCIECGNCKTRCPYELDVPELLKKNLEFYRNFIKNIEM